jgi:predicted nicotinamide N-methyase
MLAVMARPAYWAFCWASGHVLAQHLIRHPQIVQGRTIVDFGAGSGVVAIAAMLAGAKRAYACDIDAAALLACEANAILNQVEIILLPDISQLSEPVDLLIAADVLYDRDNMPFLDQFAEQMPEVLVADSRIKNLHLRGYEIIDEVITTTIPDLDEQQEFNRVKLYRGLAQK